MFDRFTDRARKVLALANQEALRFNHELLDTEHILLGLVREGSGVGAQVLKNLEVDLRRVRLSVERLIVAGREEVPMGKLPQAPRAKEVIEFAIDEAKGLHHNYVGTEHILLGLLRERSGVATQVLGDFGLDLIAARRETLIVLGAKEGRMPGRPPRQLLAACPLCESVVRAASNPALIACLDETVVLLGDNQGPRGWCVLVLRHHLEHMAQLTTHEQLNVWREVDRVAAAIRSVFPSTGKSGGPPRINYECLGNLVPHIHWHIIPRHADDPEPTKAVWGWPEAQLRGSMTAAERVELIAKLRPALA